MRLTFLGSAAAEGYPALWCRCDRCTTARQRGGRNLRFRASLLVNDDLLLDAGPDTLASAVRLGLDLAPVQALLITHPHTDHLDGTTFFWRRKGFCATPLPVLHVYASRAALDRVAHVEGRDVQFEPLRLEPHAIPALHHFAVGTGGPAGPDPRFDPPDSPPGPPLPGPALNQSAAGAAAPAVEPLPVPQTPPRAYEIWTLAARHATPEVEPMFFLIRQTAGPEVDARGRPAALLYATDTGPFPDETWAALDRVAATGIRLDAAVIDATSGLGKDSSAHMNLRQMEWHHQELARRGLFAEGAVRLAHHFSHNGTPPYEELEAYLAPRGMAQSYDGLALTV